MQEIVGLGLDIQQLQARDFLASVSAEIPPAPIA